jgi:hypothetical protein
VTILVTLSPITVSACQARPPLDSGRPIRDTKAIMPSRPWVLAVLVFWLVTAGWLVRRDLWPRFRADAPTPFVVTLVDEPRVGLLRRQQPRTMESNWSVFRQGQETEAGKATTSVRYYQGFDTLEFWGRFSLNHPERTNPLVRIESTCRAGWEGDVRGVTAQVELRRREDMEIAADLAAAVGERGLSPHWIHWGRPFHGADVPLAPRAGLLILTQPMNRIPNLRVGQRWRLPCVNLLAAARERPQAAFGPVEAEVSEDTLRWQPRGKVPCYVIDYRGAAAAEARTWVRQSDGLVLEQEFTYTDKWALPTLGASTVGLLGSPGGPGALLAGAAVVPGAFIPGRLPERIALKRDSDR